LSRIIDIPRHRRGSYNSGRHPFPTNSQADVRQSSNEGFLKAALPENVRRSHYTSRDKLAMAFADSGYGRREWNELAYNAPTTSLLVQSAHGSFAGHIPLSLRPDTIWYAIVHEIAVHVKQNSRQYAHLFTDTPDARKEIRVRHDGLRYDEPSPWNEAIPLFYPQLEANIGIERCGLFVPEFTTTTVEDKISTLVALMDVVSPYYKFTMQTMCYIPQVRLEGTAEDWASLYQRAQQLQSMFVGLEAYFVDLLDVLKTIAGTAAGGEIDEEFWSSLYKYRESSGGEYVSGWITALFAHIQTPKGLVLKDSFNWRGPQGRYGSDYKTNEFPAHVSVVPFVWEYFGDKFPMSFFAGITGVDYSDDTFLQPRLGYGVVELTG
jgi:hypothetical protein